MTRCDKVWRGVTRYEEVWQDWHGVKRCNKVWQDMTEHDRVWHGVTRYDEVKQGVTRPDHLMSRESGGLRLCPPTSVAHFSLVRPSALICQPPQHIRTSSAVSQIRGIGVRIKDGEYTDTFIARYDLSAARRWYRISKIGLNGKNKSVGQI